MKKGEGGIALKIVVSVGMLIFLSTFIFAFSGAGSGTSGDPYQINTCDLLNQTRENITAYYILNDSFSCDVSPYNTGEGFEPIGSANAPVTGGYLDGQNNTIDGLYINRPTADGAGLFAGTTGAIISDIGLTNVDILGKKNIGSFTGYDHGNSSIVNSYATGTLVGNDATATRIGGIVGFGTGLSSSPTNITNCFFSGDVSGVVNVGGFTGGGGYTSFTINNSYVVANVSGTTTVGGFVGYDLYTLGSIYNSYVVANVSGTTNVGGFVGRSALGVSTISNSYAIGNITGSSKVGGVGGLYASGTLSSVYWYNDTADSINNCYSTSTVPGDTGCTAITDVNYFYNHSNAPISGWDDSVWNKTLDNLVGNVLLGTLSYIPIINLISPISEYFYNNGTILISFGTSGTDVDTKWYYNGTVNKTYTGPVNDNFSDGLNVIILYANNSLNNLSSLSVNFTVDSTSPQIAFINSTEDNATTIDQAWIFVNISLEEVNLANITYTLWNSSLLNSTTYVTNSSTTINWTNLSYGTYVYNVTAYDSLGNSNSTGNRTIILEEAAVPSTTTEETTTSSGSSTLTNNLGTEGDYTGKTNKITYGVRHNFEYSSESHHTYLRKINRGTREVTIEVNSEKQLITIKEGGNVSVDLTGDGVADVVFVLEKIYDDSIAIDLRVEDIVAGELVVGEVITDNSVDSVKESDKTWVGFALVLVIILGIFGVIFWFKKKR